MRAQTAGRVDVLDKVKAVALLPDNVHATTEIVAAYYEVPVSTIRSLIAANREELETNGYRTLTGAELRDFASPFGGPANLGLHHNTRSLALFTRRAVLNVGQLLVGSPVARQIRTYLLNIDETATPEHRLDAVESPRVPDELELAKANAEKAARIVELIGEKRAAIARAEQSEKREALLVGGDGLTPRAFHKKHFSAVSEHEFFEVLYAKGLLIDQRGKGTRRDDGTYRNGSQHGHPSWKGKAYFYLHSGLDRREQRHENARIRRGEPEIALRELLIRWGLPANDVPGITSATQLAIEESADA
jgi:hypothetical protein